MKSWRIVKSAQGTRAPSRAVNCADCNRMIGREYSGYRFEIINNDDSRSRICPACVLVAYLDQPKTFWDRLLNLFSRSYKDNSVGSRFLEYTKELDKKPCVPEPIVWGPGN